MSPLPAGWEWATVGKLASVEGGVTPKGLKDLPPGETPLFKVGDMRLADGGRMRISRTMVDREALVSARAKLWPAGTIVFPKNGGAVATNKKSRLGVDGACDLNMMGVLPGDLVEPDYLGLWFETIDLGRLSSGSVVPKINRTDVAALAVPLPPLHEQRRIVQTTQDLLSRIEAVRVQLESVGRRIETLELSLVDEALHGDRYGLVERPLADVCELQRGFDLPARLREPGSVPVLASNGVVGYHSVAKVSGPGVVTGRSGTIGQVQVVDDDYWPLNTTLFVKDFKGNDPGYIALLLGSLRLSTYAGGSAVPSLDRKVLRSVPVAVPSVEAQRMIAKEVATARSSLSHVQPHVANALERLAQLRRVVLNLAFSGRLTPKGAASV